MFDAYVTCPQCGGEGWYWYKKKVGAGHFNMKIKCNQCAGTGEILKAKLRKKPLYDKYGKPIDQFGKIVKDPMKEAWWRKRQRQEYTKPASGRQVA